MHRRASAQRFDGDPTLNPPRPLALSTARAAPPSTWQWPPAFLAAVADRAQPSNQNPRCATFERLHPLKSAAAAIAAISPSFWDFRSTIAKLSRVSWPRGPKQRGLRNTAKRVGTMLARRLPKRRFTAPTETTPVTYLIELFASLRNKRRFCASHLVA